MSQTQILKVDLSPYKWKDGEPMKPMGKPRQTQADRWKKRKVVERYRQLADVLRAEAMLQKFRCTGVMIMYFDMPMPKSWSKKRKRELIGTPCRSRPDIDNLCKAVLDALMEEDSIVWSGGWRKLWSENPQITVYSMPDSNP